MSSIPEININIQKLDLSKKIHKIKAKWSPTIVTQDLGAYIDWWTIQSHPDPHIEQLDLPFPT